METAISGDTGKAGMKIVIKDDTGKIIATGVTGSDGTFSTSGICPGNYTVQQVDNDWKPTTQNPVSVTIRPGGATTGRFQIGVNYDFRITGSVFVDTNGNNIYEATDTLYRGPVKILYDGRTLSPTSTFTKDKVTEGSTHTITLDPTSVRGYTILPRSVYRVDVTTYPTTRNCTISPTNYTDFDGKCTTHSITVNFLIHQNAVPVSTSWIQSETLDVRIDAGYTYPISSGSSCATASVPGNSKTPGVILSGDRDPDFGAGQASAGNWNWQVGDDRFPELYKNSNPLKLSYSEAMAAARKTGNIPTLFNQDPNQTQSGIFTVTNSLAISTPTVILSPKQIVLLVNGDVNILSTIQVEKGAFLLIISNQSISVTGDIGTTPSCASSTSTTSIPAQLEGIFVADENITINSAKSCTNGGDTMLQAAGTFVVNAARRGGGTFSQNRVLCGSYATYPPFRVNPRLDMIMAFPNFLKVTSRTWREVAP